MNLFKNCRILVYRVYPVYRVYHSALYGQDTPVPFTHYRTSSMGNIGSSSTKVREFSIAGQKLKLDNASDVSEFVKQP